MKVELEILNGTPVFAVYDNSSRWSRAYGATFLKRENKWIFPAFPPFLEKVLNDLPKIEPHLSYSEDASGWGNAHREYDDTRAQIEQAAKNFPVKSYEHQVEGLSLLMHNWRYILNWEMGTGKTKVIVDLVSLLKGQRAVVLCPLIACSNWVEETAFYTDKMLTAVDIRGASRKAKFKRLERAREADIIVVPYDTARLYGIPFLAEAVVKHCRNVNQYPTATLRKHLKRVNDAKEQKRLAVEWTRGRSVQEIGQEVAELTEGSVQWLTDVGYDILVADESHRIKRIQSQRTKVCLRLSTHAPRRYELSGTLSLGDPRDLYPQLRYLAPYILKDDWQKFCDHYVDFSPYNRHIVLGYKNLHELNSRVGQVSDKKTLLDCVDLPERRFKTLFFHLTASQIKDYNLAVKEMILDVPNADPLELQNSAVRLMKLLQICSGFYYHTAQVDVCDACYNLRKCVEDNVTPGSALCEKDVETPERQVQQYGINPKLKALEDLIEDLLAGGHKVIIWANFMHEMDVIEELLTKKKVGYVRVDGTTTKHIEKLVHQFKDDDETIIYLGQIKTGIAINLTNAKYAVYYSRTFSLEDWRQSLGRNFRIGQKEKTVVYSLCARGTVEYQQLTALEQKEDISNMLTKRINCLACDQFQKCLEKGTQPWTAGCVFVTNVKRAVSKAGYVYPEFEGK